MIRISRLTDYGIVLLSHLAARPELARSAAEIAEALRLPLPTVSKLLRILCKSGLLDSQRGAKGGYLLAASPESISIARVVAALEGPVSMTQCSSGAASDCEYESLCALPPHWRRINAAIHEALAGITLAEIVSDTRRPAFAPAAAASQARTGLGALRALPRS